MITTCEFAVTQNTADRYYFGPFPKGSLLRKMSIHAQPNLPTLDAVARVRAALFRSGQNLPGNASDFLEFGRQIIDNDGGVLTAKGTQLVFDAAAGAVFLPHWNALVYFNYEIADLNLIGVEVAETANATGVRVLISLDIVPPPPARGWKVQ